MSERLGFVGPLEYADQDDRCPLCGLDPNDPTLHAPTCRTVTENLCGVIEFGRLCMAADHMPVDRDWERWREGHEWVPTTTPPPNLSANEGEQHE